MVKKNNRISLIYQENSLKSMFPNSKIKRFREESLVWIHTLTPSPLSESYKVKLEYKRNNAVKFYVLEPKLKLATGKKFLPHVYSTEKQQLCLYYPNRFEWNVDMLYTKTIIPWACEWLYFYEIWAQSGIWYGGGKHDEREAEKNEQNQREENTKKK